MDYRRADSHAVAGGPVRAFYALEGPCFCRSSRRLQESREVVRGMWYGLSCGCGTRERGKKLSEQVEGRLPAPRNVLHVTQV